MNIYTFYVAVMVFEGKALLYCDNDSMTDKYNKGFHFQKIVTVEKATEIINRYKLKMTDNTDSFKMYTVSRYFFR